ncbi:MAG TPA: hypothetical protein VLM39_11615, partial [Ignavibacteriaceae bacterium]|nr:hypothetical protein [Ignavibacteriaceae bacterium]
MKIFTSFLVIISSFSLSQTYSIKHITDFDFVSRNPVFIQYPYDIYLHCCGIPLFNNKSEIFFESLNSDSSISICRLQYDVEIDSFLDLRKISNNDFINRNAAGKFIGNSEINYKLLLWETNKNNNWDIVLSIDSGSGWTPPDLLFSS